MEHFPNKDKRSLIGLHTDIRTDLLGGVGHDMTLENESIDQYSGLYACRE